MGYRRKSLLEKRCPKCGRDLLRTDFYPITKRPGCTSAYCKDCMCADAAERRTRPGAAEANKQRGRARYAAHRVEIRAAKKISDAAKKAADPALWRARQFFAMERRDMAPDITREFIATLYREKTHCGCCGVKLCLEIQPRCTRDTKANPLSPSIDRVNNDLGYTRTNIAVVCWRCNFRKTDLTLADLEMFRDYVIAHGVHAGHQRAA